MGAGIAVDQALLEQGYGISFGDYVFWQALMTPREQESADPTDALSAFLATIRRVFNKKAPVIINTITEAPKK